MSKEEIASFISQILVDNKYRSPLSDGDIAIHMVDIPKCTIKLLSLLDTYAQEIAVGFAEWMNEQNWGYWSKNRWVKAGVNKTYSTPQLFQQFLTNKNEKK